MADHFAEEAYRAIRHDATWRVVARDGIVVEGGASTDWLQGQLSQDLARLSRTGMSAETLVLSPQGKIDSYCRVTKLADEPPRYLLDLKAGAGPGLHERLRRFKLRVKASVEMLDVLHAIEQRGPASTAMGTAKGEGWEPGGNLPAELGALAEIAVSWPGFEGSDLLFTGDPARVRRLAPSLGLRDLGDADGAGAGIDAAFEAARIEAGLPELGRELTERTIPQEAGELAAHAVSFTKGCYTGQELVARIDARGSNTPRRLRGVVLRDLSPENADGFSGSPIMREGQQVGEVTSAAWSPGLETVVALAYLKRSVGVPADVAVEPGGTAGGGAPKAMAAEARELPLVDVKQPDGRTP